MNKKFNLLFLSAVFVVVVAVFYFGYIGNMKSNISHSVLRLHIIGADNTKEAQDVKLKVRDRILDEFSDVFKKSSSPEEAANSAVLYKNQIEEAAEDELSRHGIFDPVTAEVEVCRFPTKNYGDISLPQGKYTALNVKIGSAKGENWWCVMHPPLCLSDKNVIADEETKKKLKEALTEEEYALITKTTPDIKVKLRVGEIIGEWCNM